MNNRPQDRHLNERILTTVAVDHQVQMVTRRNSIESKQKPDIDAHIAFGLASYMAKRLSIDMAT